MDGEKPLEAQALVHTVWGVAHMDGYTLGKKHAGVVLTQVQFLADQGKVVAPHAAALRTAAADAGLEEAAVEAALEGV